MSIGKLLGLTVLATPLTSEEGRRILERDHYRCQYCGFDGMSSFENSLSMTVDFVHPRAKRGRKDPSNLVAACRPCNVLKGYRLFHDFQSAKAFVLQRREAMRKSWDASAVPLADTDREPVGTRA